MTTSIFSAVRWILLPLLPLLPLAGWAQGYAEKVNLSTEFLPLTLQGPDQKSDFHAQVSRVTAVFPYFLKADKSQSLVLGAAAETFRFEDNRPGFDVSRLHSVTPLLGYSRQMTAKLRLTGVFTPTLASDFRRITGGDVQLGGIVRAVYSLNPTLTLRGAVGYQQTFYGPLYIVLAGFDWQASEKVRIFGDLPNTLTVRYAAASKLNIGFDLLGNAGSYRLALDDRYVRYRSGVAGLFAEYYVAPNVALRATGGYSIVRNLEIYAKNDRVDGVVDFFNLGTEPTPLSPTIDKGMVLRLALSYRLPTR